MNSQTQRLMALAEGLELFRTPARKLYATATVNGHCETWELGSSDFSRLLSYRYYSETKTAPAHQPMQEAIRNLQAKAQFDGAEKPVFLRVAEHCGRIYLDLADDKWQVVEIDGDGWRMVANAPVKFRRSLGMQALPTPIAGGSINELRRLTNLSNDSDWHLAMGWELATLRPSGPYPILVLVGEHGSSKSTLARMLQALVDPSCPDLRSEPRSAHDLMIAASNGWLLSFDNLSYVSPWLSDALCRLATGGGQTTRKLYSDSEEALFQVQRPVMVNGIGDLVTRSDLLSRCVIIDLPTISPSQRRLERELWQEFDAARPRILGGLLDAVATALRRLPTTTLPHHPRMADFAVWVSSAETDLGWGEGTFLEAYEQSQSSANELALDASCVSAPLFALLGKAPFEGTAECLLVTLTKNTNEAITKTRQWPKTARALRGILNRLAPNLRAAGVELGFRRLNERKRTRMISIQFSASGPSAPSEETPTEAAIYSSDPVETTPNNAIRQQLDEIKNETQEIINLAKADGDFRSAIAGKSLQFRVVQQEQKDYSPWDHIPLPPSLRPFPGNPGGPPLTEESRKAIAEVESFSPADRMAMREGFTAAVRMSQIEAEAKKKEAAAMRDRPLEQSEKEE